MPSLKLKVTPISQSVTLKQRTYTALKVAIEQMNIYDHNAQLRLDERVLSQQFGISRTPLREALARLEYEGLVRTYPRRGVFLIRKSKSEILDMITLWAALESMAARLITLDASDSEIATLRELVAKYEDKDIPANLDEYSDSNIEFHQRILKLSKCKILEETAAGLFMHMRAIRARTIGEDDRAFRSVVDHSHIISALEARDTELAERLVREHTLNLRSHVERYLNLNIEEHQLSNKTKGIA